MFKTISSTTTTANVENKFVNNNQEQLKLNNEPSKPHMQEMVLFNTSNSADANHRKLPDSIPKLIEQYENLSEHNNIVTFLRDSMIIALKYIRTTISDTHCLKKETSQIRCDEINNLINQLNNFNSNNSLEEIKIFGKKITDFLNTQRSGLFANQVETTSNTIYHEIMYGTIKYYITFEAIIMLETENKLDLSYTGPNRQYLFQAVIHLHKNQRNNEDNQWEDWFSAPAVDLALVNIINPSGIFINQEDPRTMAMFESLKNIFTRNKWLGQDICYQLVETVFISQSGILADPNHHITIAMIKAATDIVRKHQLTPDGMNVIYNFYLQNVDQNPAQLSRLEKLLVTLLCENKLREPEVITKIIFRLWQKKINVQDTGQKLNFFAKLSMNSNSPLITILMNNLDYFIKVDGITSIVKILQEYAVIIPARNTTIEEKTQKQLISELQVINKNININSDAFNTMLLNIRTMEINKQANQIIRQLIKSYGNIYLEAEFKDINEIQLESLLQTIYAANNINNVDPKRTEVLRLAKIKHSIRDIFFGQSTSDLTKEQENSINDFVGSLAKIGIEIIKYNYVQTTYLTRIGIYQNQYKNAYDILRKYLNWSDAIKEYKEKQFEIIFKTILIYDKQLKETDLDLYLNFILNTLAFRSYQNILDIVRQINIPKEYKKQLELVIIYCKLQGLDENDNTSLNLFVTKLENTLIHITDLSYLNRENLLISPEEQFSIKFLTNEQYQQLDNMLENNNSLGDNDEIDCTKLDKIIFIHLKQIADNSNMHDIRYIIIDFAKTKKITKANLNKILNNQEIKIHMCTVVSQSLDANNFTKIKLAQYLSNLIGNKFSVANIVAKHINSITENIIKNNNIVITIEQRQQLTDILYQLARNPGKDITISLKFKKQLMDTFKDADLLITETDVSDANGTRVIPAGDFIQLKQNLEFELAKPTNKNTLPELLVAKADKLPFTDDSEQIPNVLYTKLNELSALKNQVSQHEIFYILGVVFMDLSSIHALGYHLSSDENVSFTRFRLLGAYYLARSIQDNGTWSENEKDIISNSIKQAILKVDCSGLIVNQLFGPYCDYRLKNIYNKIIQILQANMTTSVV